MHPAKGVVVSTMTRPLCLLLIPLNAACADRGSSAKGRPAKVVPTTTQYQGADVSATDREFQRHSAEVVAAGSAAAPMKPPDGKKGDQNDESWVPAEFKAGAARWKD